MTASAQDGTSHVLPPGSPSAKPISPGAYTQQLIRQSCRNNKRMSLASFSAHCQGRRLQWQ
eukprot:5413409-Amphidinium_carterae.1